MQPSPWEVVFLRPTPIFYSFLASQVPESNLPDYKLLQADNTAYAISKKENDEDTINEIEHNFTAMFRHEITRWLGKDARNEIETSFFDFLCCFKLELHGQIALFEPSFVEGKQALCIKPKKALLQWMRSAVGNESELNDVLDKVNVSQLSENSTVVVKNFKQLSNVKMFLEHAYMDIYRAEMLRMSDEKDNWPKINTFNDFRRFFNCEIHTQLIHLH